MLSSSAVLGVIRFVLLVLAQVLIFNDMGFYGLVNPMVYVLFVYWYPIENNRTLFLLVSFLLGLTLDAFSDSLALHTMATTTIAFVRPLIMRFCFGANFDFQGFSLRNTSRIQRYTLLALLIFVHHLIFFSLEAFSFSHFLLILKKLLFVGLGTFVLSFLINTLFSREGNR